MCSDFTFFGLIGAASTATARSMPAPQLDGLMLFGFLAMFATLTCAVTPHESRNKLVVFAFCLACCAVYGFLQGAWPLGIVESVWAGASLRRWHVLGRVDDFVRRRQIGVSEKLNPDSRIGRITGSK